MKKLWPLFLKYNPSLNEDGGKFNTFKIGEIISKDYQDSFKLETVLRKLFNRKQSRYITKLDK